MEEANSEKSTETLEIGIQLCREQDFAVLAMRVELKNRRGTSDFWRYRSDDKESVQ